MSTRVWLTAWVVQSVLAFFPMVAVMRDGDNSVDKASIIVSALFSLIPIVLLLVFLDMTYIGVQVLKSYHRMAGGSTFHHGRR